MARLVPVLLAQVLWMAANLDSSPRILILPKMAHRGYSPV